MKIWVDISNAPQALFFRKFLEEQEDVLITARDFGAISHILKGLDYKLIGKHGGNEKVDKLVESSKRIIELAKIVKDFQPKVCVHKYSVEGARVAIGLGIRYLAVMDNEFARAQNLLTLPFADKVICPSAIPDAKLKEYNKRFAKFEGVCEVANIKNLKKDESVLKELGLDPKKKIAVMRPEAYNASYMDRTGAIDGLIGNFDENVQVVVMPRDPKEEYLGNNVIVSRKPVDALSLMHFADVVVSGGGSMSREAALMGTRSISVFPHKLAVDDYLIGKGLLERIYSQEKKIDVEKGEKMKVPEMEDPFELIKREIGNG
ncbi:DUF354 domain-containing protein [Candidatus Undinarchaeota archaeon]